MKTLFLFALLSPAVQDAATEQNVARLIERLKADEAPERESAARELARIGSAALPQLREALKAGDLELRSRVKEAIKAIETASKVKELDRAPKTVTADLKDTPVEVIVRTIAEQTGTKIDASGLPAGHKFSFAARELPVLQALDRLCTESDLLSHEGDGAGGFRLTVGKWIPYPSAYSGASRLRIKSLQAVRTQTFQQHAAHLQLNVEPDFDPSFKPLRNWSLEIDEIVDDQGAKLESSAKKQDRRMALALGAAPSSDSRTFAYTGLSPLAVRLATVRATLTCSFPTETQEVVFESPARGSSQDLGRFKVLVTNASTDSVANATNLQLTFSPIVGSVADLKQEIDSRFESASVILVDAEGVEHQAVSAENDQHRFMRPEAKDPREIDYYFKVPKRLQRADRKALKLRFHKETWQKVATFEFKDVKLP